MTCYRILGLLFCLCLSLSCSRFSLVYPYSDWYLEREINQYFCLEGQLEEKVEQDLQNFLFWHQKKTFPKLVKVDLSMAAEAIQNGTESKAVMKKLRESFFKIWWDSVETFKPEVKHLLTQLETKNIKCLEEHIAEKWEEEKEELEDNKKEYAQDKYEEYFERMETYVGSVTKEQKKRIKQIYQPKWEEDFLRKKSSHVRRLRFLKQLKEAKKSKEALTKWAERVLTVPHALYESKEAWEKQRRAQGEGFYSVLKVVALLNPKQRKYLLRKINKYSKEFTNMSKKKIWSPSQEIINRVNGK